MRAAALLAANVLALALVGCEVGPDYAPPATEKESLAFAPVDTAEATSAGVVADTPIVREWWRTLEDKELDALVEAAVNANLDLKTAESRVREARALRGIAASALYPRLEAGGSAGVGAQDDRALHGAAEYQTGFDATWELDVFGGVRRGVEAADASVEAAVESRRNVLVTLLGELGRNYVELRGEQRQLAIARENVELQTKTLELVKVRKLNGLASDLEVNQAATQLETTRATVPSLEAAVAQSIFRLGVLLARPPEALANELGEAAPIPRVPPSIPIGLPSGLLERRPDIRAAERSMAIASARLGVATAELYPKFALTGSVGFGSSHGLQGAPSFYVGPSFSWPIFTGGRVTSEILAQDARLEQAVLAYRSTLLAVFEELDRALVQFSKERVRRDTLGRAAEDARRAADLASTQYQNGLVDFLNVVEAQGTLASAETALAVSDETLLTDLIAVYKALGGGWDVFDARSRERELAPSNTELPR